MPLYECKICNLSTRLLGDYNRHLNTFKHKRNIEKLEENMVKSQKEPKKSQKEPVKSQKEPVKSQKEPENEPKKSQYMENTYVCEFCNETFSTYANKRRHELHRCKKNNNTMLKIINDKDKYIQKIEQEHLMEKTKYEKEKKEYEKEKKELYKKIDDLISKVGNTYNQNIILNNYGSEDLSHISNTFKTELLKVPYMMIPKMIEAVHFNKEKPENKNIALTNKKENRLKVYKNNRWVYQNKKEVISSLMDSNYYTLDSHYDISKTKLNSFCQSNYIKFREFMDEKDKEMIETLKDECENILLNNR